jgi:hypothetical protein
MQQCIKNANYRKKYEMKKKVNFIRKKLAYFFSFLRSRLMQNHIELQFKQKICFKAKIKKIVHIKSGITIYNFTIFNC